MSIHINPYKSFKSSSIFQMQMFQDGYRLSKLPYGFPLVLPPQIAPRCWKKSPPWNHLHVLLDALEVPNTSRKITHLSNWTTLLYSWHFWMPVKNQGFMRIFGVKNPAGLPLRRWESTPFLGLFRMEMFPTWYGWMIDIWQVCHGNMLRFHSEMPWIIIHPGGPSIETSKLGRTCSRC